MLAVLVLAAVMPRPASAGVGIAGSKHDFSSITGARSITPGGACAACHNPHYSASVTGIWSRSLTGETTYFNQTADPNYDPNFTTLCYDCHENSASTAVENPLSPPYSTWDISHDPRNVAFTDERSTSKSDPSDPGYYELQNGVVANTSNPAPDPPSAPMIESIGGHFFKGRLGDLPSSPYELGDKLACYICHDPHDKRTGGNQVMFRDSITDGTSTITPEANLQASKQARNGTGTGRKMCAACHQYSDSGGAEKELFGVSIPKPPSIEYVGHAAAPDNDSTACTRCHPHNSPDCGACHGNPPPDEAFNYSRIDETRGPHPRHAELQTAVPAGYDFSCKACHADFPASHNQPVKSYTSVVFDARNPSGSFNAATPGVCGNLYCHSRGTYTDETVNNTGGTTVTWTDANWGANDLGCESCHGNTAARVSGTIEYGAPGYANKITVNAKLKANSHGAHRAYRCSICHWNTIRDTDPVDGWVLYSLTTHVNGTIDVVPDPNVPASNFDSYTWNVAGGICTNVDCHAGRTAQWGNTDVSAPGTDRANCIWCHGRTNALGGDADNWDFDDMVAARLNSDQWTGATATGHGRTTAQGWYPWPNKVTARNPANLSCLSTDVDTPTAGCHIAEAAHYQANNPFRLATPDTGYAFERPNGTLNNESVNAFCRVCHTGTPMATHCLADTGGNNWGSPGGAASHFKCVDCHDVHGDSPDYMIHAQVFADSSDDYSAPSTSDLGILPVGTVIAFNVTEPNQTAADYVSTSGGSLVKICQVCHQTNTAFTRTLGTHPHQGGGECMGCHPHPAFPPSNCEGCHNGNPAFPLAPNVITYWDGTWWDTNRGSPSDAVYQQGGHGDPDAKPALSCGDCHNTSDPPGTHPDGTLQSYSTGILNENTSHLKSFYFDLGGNAWDTQVNFDGHPSSNTSTTGCWGCHRLSSVPPHAHDKAGTTVDAVQFGLSGTIPDGSVLPWPIDIDIKTRVGGALLNFATCATCHDPHGTGITDFKGSSGAAKGTNKMIRANFLNQPNELCVKCH